MASNVTYIREEDLIRLQAEAEALMLEELESGDYTFDRPLVKLNPYLISPLAAVVLFKTQTETAVTVTVRGKEPSGDMGHTFPKGRVHVLPVLGLYADYENTVEIRLYQGASAVITIKTDPPAASVPALIHMETTAAYLKKDLIVVSPSVNGALTGFDYRGDARWYINVPMQMAVKRLRNGRLLVGSHRVIAYPYYAPGLYELDMVGKIYKEYQLPGGYHHDQFELPNGDILVLTEDFYRDTTEDVLVAIDPESGKIKRTWDFRDFLVPGEGKSGKATDEDWFHNNAVWYDENTNSLTLSGRHVDAMVNIDYDTGALRWIIGDPETWSEDKRKYFFTPVGDNFSWQYAQHACLVTPGGDIMCFDNGTLRSKHEDKYLLNRDNYSRGVRYRINTQDMTIEQKWEFGRELKSEFFSQHISNVVYYGEGHYMIHSGGQQLLNGESSEDILRGDGPGIRRECCTYEVVDGEVALNLRLKGAYYRAEKLSLYYGGANLALGEGRKLGSMVVTELSAALKAIDAGEDLPAGHMAHIIEEDDRITLKARFEGGQEAALLLERGGEARYYKISTGENRFAAMCCVPYIPADDNNTSTFVNKNGLSGEYRVSLVIDGKKYDTGVTVSC